MDPPLPNTPCIELSFINAYYDFSSDTAKAEKSTSSTFEIDIDIQFIESSLIIDIQFFVEEILWI